MQREFIVKKRDINHAQQTVKVEQSEINKWGLDEAIANATQNDRWDYTEFETPAYEHEEIPPVFTIDTEQGQRQITFKRWFRRTSGEVDAFEFECNEALEVDGDLNTYFRIDIPVPHTSITRDILVYETSEYVDAQEDAFLVMREATSLFDLAQLTEFAYTAWSNGTIPNVQDEYNEWLKLTSDDDDDDDDEAQNVNRRILASLDLPFDQSAPYAEMELWQSVLANANEMTHVCEGTDIEKDLRRIAEDRIKYLKSAWGTQEDYSKAYPDEDYGEEYARKAYILDLALLCGLPITHYSQGHIRVPRRKVYDVARVLQAYGQDYGQLMCYGWAEDNEPQEVNLDTIIEWRADGANLDSFGLPPEYINFFLS